MNHGTLIQIAAMHGHEEEVQILLEHGAAAQVVWMLLRLLLLENKFICFDPFPKQVWISMSKNMRRKAWVRTRCGKPLDTEIRQ